MNIYTPFITRQPIVVEPKGTSVELHYVDDLEPGVGGYFFAFLDYKPEGWAKLKEAGDELTLLGLLVGVTPPTPKVEVITWQGFGDWKPSHATNWDYEHEVTLKFYETRTNFVSKTLLDWLKAARTNDARGYKANIIILNTPPDLTTIKFALLLVGCIPVSVELPEDYDVTSNDLTTTSVQLYVDKVYFEEDADATYAGVLATLREQVAINVASSVVGTHATASSSETVTPPVHRGQGLTPRENVEPQYYTAI